MEPAERFRLEALRADVAAQARALRGVSDPRSGVDRRAAELADQHLADLAKRGIERRGGDRRAAASSGRQERGMRKRLKREWLASLSPEQRAAERYLRRR